MGDGNALSLHSVQDMVDATRALLLDKTPPYRYDDTALTLALNIALLEMKRLRPDMFAHKYRQSPTQYAAPSGEEICVEEQFRPSLLFGIAAYVLLRDEEDVQDARANTFLARFESMLTGIAQAPIHGGSPSPQQAQKPTG